MTTVVDLLITTSLTDRPAWRSPRAHAQKARALHLRDLFTHDGARGERLTAEAAGLFVDYSKNRITAETIQLLLQLAEESGSTNNLIRRYREYKENV